MSTPKRVPKQFIIFKTACGCSRVESVPVGWRPEPYINVPTMFAMRAHDWINEPEPPLEVPKVSRRFMLTNEEFVGTPDIVFFIYQELMD